MKKLKIVTVVGTRPEIIRLSRVMAKLEQLNAVEHILIHTGQNYDYELNEIFFKDLNLKKPDYFLECRYDTPMETVGNILIKIDGILDKIKPDAFLVLGDTNSCLCAIAAKRKKIPIFHMEAGNRCFDQNVPEEINRKIVDHISDINLPYSGISRQYLLDEGISADRIIRTGSPMFEVLKYYEKEIEESDILEKLDIEKNEYFLLSAHREENIGDDNNFCNLVDSINFIAEKYLKPVILSAHPRTRKMIDQKEIEFHPLVKIMKPTGFFDFVKLQCFAKTVLSDSGTISEESSILGFKALNLRSSNERPEAMEEAAVMMVGVEKERIMQGLEILEEQKEIRLRPVPDYQVDNVSDKIIRIIISYVDYINKVVWSKNQGENKEF